MEDLEIPKTHALLRHAFGKHLILSGKLPKELGRSLRRAFRLRQQSDYELYASLGTEIVATTVEQAETFLREVEQYTQLRRGHRQ